MSNWEPKTVFLKIKEKVYWPFKNKNERALFVFIISFLVITTGFFSFFLNQKRAKAETNISNWEDLYNIKDNLSGDYILTTTLDSSSEGYDDYAGPLANGSEGWLPIGDNITPFTGTFNGQGYKIKDLFINRVGFDYSGLFGYVDGGNISNIGLENLEIVSRNYVGGLVGYLNNGIINLSYTSGIINGTDYLGGLVGAVYLVSSNIENSYSITDVSGTDYLGGFIGYNEGEINYSYSAGEITGSSSLGGFIGENTCPGYVCTNVTNSFYDKDTSNQTDNTDKGIPKTTLEMKEVRTFTDVLWSDGLDNPYDFTDDPYDDISNDDFWDIDVAINNGYPFLNIFVIYPPVLTTNNAEDISSQSATLKGNISDTGKENSSVRGFKYYQSNDCTGIEEDTNESGSFGIGEYFLEITSLSSNTTYSYKAYAENSSGLGEGSCVSFTTSGSLISFNYYNLSLGKNYDEGGEVFGEGSFLEGSTVSIGATPNTGYKFLSWTNGEEVVSTESNYFFTIYSNYSLVANFEKEGYLIINLPEGLSIYNSLTGEDMTISPQKGEVLGILKKGDEIISEIKINFISDLNWQELKGDTSYYFLNEKKYGRSFLHFEDKELSGVSDIILYVPYFGNSDEVYICPFSNSFENINENCEGIYYLKVEPVNGYYKVKVENTGSSEKPKIVKYIISLNVNIDEGGYVEGEGEYPENGNVTIRAFNNENYLFLNWTEGDEIVSDLSTFTFQLNSNRYLTANFKAIDEDIIFGCTDINALNYDPNANIDDSSCTYQIIGEEEEEEEEEEKPPQVFGCTDINALNYNPNANREDFSCRYEENFIAPVVTERIEEIKEIINSPIGEATTKIISTVGATVGAGSLVASAIFINPFSFSNFFFSILRLWSLLLVFIGVKKRHKPWGTVYDSITKQPLDPAYVFLQDEKGEIISDSITDLDGRYGFLVKPGNYKIVSNKTNYAFPSEKLKGKNEDGIYDNLYFGEIINVQKEGDIIAKNIPMDPVNFDWNEFAKKESKKMKFYSDLDRLFSSKIVDVFFIFGFFISIIAAIFAPYPYNLIVLGLYIFLIILRNLGLTPRKGGYIREKETGNPLSSAIIKVFLPDIERETLKKVASNTGKYFCLVPPGIYYVKIEKKNPDGSYTHVYTSKKINAKKGIIKENFEV